MKKATSLIFAAQFLLASALIAQPTQPIQIGVLLLAHGGSAQSWNDEVRKVAAQVDPTVPTEVAFGMATRSTIQAGIDRLTARGVTQIVAVPLFVSSHSSVIDSTAYLLGQRSQMPKDLKMFATMDHGSMDHGSMSRDQDKATTPSATAHPDGTQPIHTQVTLFMASALDHHRVVAEILEDRAASISHDPAKEIVVLIAHGPVPDDENRLWLADMRTLADQFRAQTHYADITYLTLRDDAGDKVRDAATAQLREQIETINKSGRNALIVPLLLSYGGIEDGLRKRLDGLSYTMASQGLLPDPRISTWVLDSVRATATIK